MVLIAQHADVVIPVTVKKWFPDIHTAPTAGGEWLKKFSLMLFLLLVSIPYMLNQPTENLFHIS
jgi:hypothetical protein